MRADMGITRRRSNRIRATSGGQLDSKARGLLECELRAASGLVRRVGGARICFNGMDRSRNSSEVSLAAANSPSPEARAPRIPIARLRSLYRLDAVTQRLARLQQQQEHEGLRNTYER